MEVLHARWELACRVGCSCMCMMLYVLTVPVQNLLSAVPRSAVPSPKTANYAAAQAWMKFSPKLNYPKQKPLPNHLYMQLVFALSYKNNNNKKFKKKR